MAQWGLPDLGKWKVVNAGAPGFTTKQIRLRTAALLDQYHPDVVVLEAGINDLKYLGLHPKWHLGAYLQALDNLKAITSEASQRHCKVIVLTIWPPAKPSLLRWFVWSQAVPKAVTKFNQALQGLASASNGIRVVDLFYQSGLKPNDEFYKDTLHLKPLAYERLTPLLQTELDRLEPNP